MFLNSFTKAPTILPVLGTFRLSPLLTWKALQKKQSREIAGKRGHQEKGNVAESGVGSLSFGLETRFETYLGPYKSNDFCWSMMKGSEI